MGRPCCQPNRAGVRLQNADQVQATCSASHLYYGFKVPGLLVEPVKAVYTKVCWREARISREKAVASAFRLGQRSIYNPCVSDLSPGTSL